MAPSRVLIVDSDPYELRATEKMLARGNLSVVASANPRAALGEMGPFRAVFAAQQFPQMTGDAFLREVSVVFPGARRILMASSRPPPSAFVGPRGTEPVQHVLMRPFESWDLAVAMGEEESLVRPAPPKRTIPIRRTDEGAPKQTKILIVDDCDVTLLTTQAVLEEGGFQALTLKDPLGFVTLAQAEKPDLVLLDVNMPTIKGPKLLQTVRAFGILPQTRFVLYSGSTREELAAMVEQCGAHAFIQKTGDAQTLVREVQRILASPPRAGVA